MAANFIFTAPVSFYFKIKIDGFDAESNFQEVTGLTMSVDTVALNEGVILSQKR